MSLWSTTIKIVGLGIYRVWLDPCTCRHSTDREIAIMILMAYFSYMIAEVNLLNAHTRAHLYSHFQEVWYVVPLLTCVYLQLLSLSGILTVFFCGIVMSHYTWHNVTESSKITTRSVQKHSPRSNRVFMNIVKLFMTWLQAHICNTVIHRGNLHIPLCWDGCSW